LLPHGFLLDSKLDAEWPAKIHFILPERDLKLSNAGNLQLITLFLAPWLSINSSHYLNQQFGLRLKTSATHCIIPEKGLKITI
jgi:hypothetical protein